MIKILLSALFSLFLSVLVLQQPAFSAVRTLVPAVPSKFLLHKHAKTKLHTAMHHLRHLCKSSTSKKNGTNISKQQKTASSKLSNAQREALRQRFTDGEAGKDSPDQLAKAGVFSSYPLKGGVFKRKSDIRAIVIHSTETASEASATRIIRSWNNAGPNHPGTQYIVDRNGTIYQTVNPNYGTYHVDSSKTLEGVKNDNSVGIEIVRTGRQQYTAPQLDSVTLLVHYLKDHFNVKQIYGHGQIQPSDRTDPVGFDWTAFQNKIKELETSEIASKRASLKEG